ncbi:MAG: response regulator transcription factor [Balneolaceae bacterium]|nr:response regulator transcription factor [Balneolaceae bacterium]
MEERPNKLIKIIIIEDNRYMREGWSTILDFEPEFVVLGGFESCEDAFESDLMSKADIVLLDIELPGMSGIEGVEKNQNEYPDLSVIMATVFDDNKNVFDALCAGAIGYLMKKVSPEELRQAIRDASRRGSPMTPNIARKVIYTFHKPVTGNEEEQLNERELEILEQLAKGKSYAAIGNTVFLSTDGVRYHIRNIYRKLQVHSRSEAVSKVISRRLINPDENDRRG